MKKKEYGILFNVSKKIINQEEMFIFNPISITEGYVDEENEMFIDNTTNEKIPLCTNPILHEKDVSVCIGEVINNKEMKELIPNISNIKILKIEYFKYIKDTFFTGKYNEFNDCIDFRGEKIIQDKSQLLSMPEVLDQNEEGRKQPEENLKNGDISITYEDYIKNDLTLICEDEIKRMFEIEDPAELQNYILDLVHNKDNYKEKSEKNGASIVIQDEDLIKLSVQDSLFIKNHLLKNYNKGKDQCLENNIAYENIKLLIKNFFSNVLKPMRKDIPKAKNLFETKLMISDMLRNIKLIGIDINCLLPIEERATIADFTTLIEMYGDTLIKIVDLLSLEEIIQASAKLNFAAIPMIRVVEEEYEGLYSEPLNVLLKDEKEIKEDEEKAKDIKEVIEEVNNSMQKLNKLIGLEGVKEQVESFKNLKLFEAMTKDYLNISKGRANMVFYGNPGTGKTTVANCLGEILYALGYTITDKVTTCTSTDLIGGYVGQTGIKTRNLLLKNKGGIILIDEAYSLVSEGNLSFANEAIVEILKELEKNDTVFIFAGYKDEMEMFINKNPGLKSRIDKYFNFENYSLEQLYQIFELKLNEKKKGDSKYGYNISEELKEEILSIINNYINDKEFSNGRFVSKLLDLIITTHANRVIKEDLNSLDSLLTLQKEDITEEGIKTLSLKKTSKKIGFIKK